MKKSFITSTTVVVAKTIQLDQISAFQISIEIGRLQASQSFKFYIKAENQNEIKLTLGTKLRVQLRSKRLDQTFFYEITKKMIG